MPSADAAGTNVAVRAGAGCATAMSPGVCAPPRVRLRCRSPQTRGAGEPFRSALMGFLEGNSDVLDRLVTEMYARGMSTGDVEDAFRDATGELLISKSAVR